MRTIYRWLCGQKECPSAKCFGLRRKHRLWCMGIHCVGRNTSACGRTDLLMSKWGRSFIMYKCVRACLRVSRTCLRICVEFILGGRFYIIEVVQFNYLCTEEHLEEAVIERSTKNTLCANSTHAWKSEFASHLTRATLGQCCPTWELGTLKGSQERPKGSQQDEKNKKEKFVSHKISLWLYKI